MPENWEKKNGKMKMKRRTRESRAYNGTAWGLNAYGSSTRPRQIAMDESDDEDIGEGSVSGGEEYAELVSSFVKRKGRRADCVGDRSGRSCDARRARPGCAW